jgi:hypothetical protein
MSDSQDLARKILQLGSKYLPNDEHAVYIADAYICAFLDDEIEEAIAAFRKQGQLPASCGVNGHLALHEVGDEYGHSYCLICDTVNKHIVAEGSK